MRTDHKLHVIITAALTILLPIFLQSLWGIGLAFGLGLLKEVFDWISSKFPENIKEKLRKTKIFGCSGFSFVDILMNFLGVCIGGFLLVIGVAIFSIVSGTGTIVW